MKDISIRSFYMWRIIGEVQSQEQSLGLVEPVSSSAGASVA